MANQVLNDLTKLKSVLHTSGISQKNQPLHQVIWGLIEFCQKNFQGLQAGTIGPGPASTVINQTLQQFFLGSSDSDDGGGGDTIPGPPGIPGVNGMVPYYVAPNETFTVPIFKQALFSMNIDNEGILDVEGFLIEVDGDFEEEIQTDSSTGTVNNLAIGVFTTQLILTNATDVTFTGFTAGWNGQVIRVFARGAGNAYFMPQNAGSSANNRFITYFTIGPTPIAAGFGDATFQYSTVDNRWHLIAHDQGDFISIPFASCVYDSNTGAFWTVIAANITSQKFFIVGRTLFIHVTIVNTTTLAGVGARLRVDFSAFAGWQWLNTTRNYARVVDGGAAQAGMITLGAGTSLIQLSHDTADTAWAVGAGRNIDGATVQGMLT